mmetsp:Transcript_56942/g.124492  ORF Transcript_56942/g.124492 Transcript_56942/m.124492 type:complete len:223 (-) Transcript_56942:460-1128(-)
MRLDGAHLRAAGPEEQLLLAAPGTVLQDLLLGGHLNLPALQLKEGHHVCSGTKHVEILHVPRIPSANGLLIPVPLAELPGAFATPSVSQESVQLRMDLLDVFSVDLNVAQRIEDHLQVLRIAQRMIVSSENHLLLTVSTLGAIIGGIASHQAPPLPLGDLVANVGAQKSKVTLQASRSPFEDLLTRLVVAIAEVFVAIDALRREAICKVHIQGLQDISVLLL